MPELLSKKETAMAFLNRMKMKKMAQVASVVPHPLLSETTLDSAVRTAYVEGCVLAALIDDAKVSDAENSIILEIGLSLQMPEGDIAECLEHVKALPDDDEKQAFVEEICGMLGQEPLMKHFIRDFEKVLKANGKISSEAQELFDYICTRLFRDSNWSQNKGGGEDTKQIIAANHANENSQEQSVAQKECRAGKEAEHKKAKTFNVVLTKQSGPFADFVNYVAGHLDCDLEAASNSWNGGHGILFERISRKAAEDAVRRLEQIGCHAEIQDCRDSASSVSSAVRDFVENPFGKEFNVWLVKRPEQSYKLIEGMTESVLQVCGGVGKLRDLLYRYGTGSLCSNVSRNIAEAVRSCVERCGGEVEIRPS